MSISGADQRRKITALGSMDTLRATAERITYRRIKTREDLEAIGDLRCRAFDRTSVYQEKFGSSVIEPIDLLPETYLYGVFEGSNLVASVRLNKLESGSVATPAMSLFDAFLKPLIDQGTSFIDPSRLVVDPEAVEELPGLALLTLRLGPLATRCLTADYCLAAIKKEHVPFYRRVFQMSRMAGPIYPSHMNVEAYLLAVARQSWPDLVRRYPVFHYTETERRMLFEDDVHGMPYLSVVPTIAYQQPQAV